MRKHENEIIEIIEIITTSNNRFGSIDKTNYEFQIFQTKMIRK